MYGERLKIIGESPVGDRKGPILAVYSDSGGPDACGQRETAVLLVVLGRAAVPGTAQADRCFF
jgi:hypothetical protein